MIEAILVLTLFNFLFISTGLGIYIYKFIIKYIVPKLEAKRIERVKLIEEHNRHKEGQNENEPQKEIKVEQTDSTTDNNV